MKSQEKKIGEVFDFIGEENLTERNCYNRLGIYPVYSGQTENDGIVCRVNFFKEKEPCLTFTTYGSAGKLSFREGKFTIGRNCMGLKPKAEFRDKINIKWFLYTNNKLFIKNRKGDKKGQGLLNKTILENVKFELPEDMSYQNKIVERYDKLLFLRNALSKIIENINSLQARPFYFEGKENLGEIPTKEIFDLISGNSGLTEEYVYTSIQNEDRPITFLGGSLNEEVIKIPLMNHPRKDGKINYLNNQEGILIVRKGKAGAIRYLPKGKFATNDDAYLLTLKKEFQDRIELKWITYEHKDLFLKYSSSSDNGTWNKGRFFNEAKIKIIPLIYQKKIIAYYDRLNELKRYLLNILERIENLMDKEFYIN